MKLNPATNCGCCGPSICVTACTPAVPVAGALIQLFTGATLVDSCTTGVSGCCPFSETGTYTVKVTVNGSIVYTGSQTLASSTITIPISVVPVTFCVQDTGGTALSGASVVVQSGGSTVASCTTGVSGCCMVNVPSAGSYTVVVSDSGYVTSTTTISLACNGTYTIVLCTTGNCVTFHVQGCSNPVPGATVTFDGQTGTTDSSGICCLGIPAAGTYTWSVSSPRFVTQTGSLTVGACISSSHIISLSPQTGYHCINVVGCYLPIADTLNLTDSVWGACTLTYDAFYGGWVGSTTISFGGGCVCTAAGSATVWYLYNGASVGVFCHCISNSGGFCPQVTAVLPATDQLSCFGTFTQTCQPLDATQTCAGCLPCVGFSPPFSKGSCGGSSNLSVIYQVTSFTMTVTE